MIVVQWFILWWRYIFLKGQTFSIVAALWGLVIRVKALDILIDASRVECLVEAGKGKNIINGVSL